MESLSKDNGTMTTGFVTKKFSFSFYFLGKFLLDFAQDLRT